MTNTIFTQTGGEILGLPALASFFLQASNEKTMIMNIALYFSAFTTYPINLF